ncbi:MAG: hypothetical protein RIR01_2392 [Bacteroidota bacterium]|jgi:hypothetical protein
MAKKCNYKVYDGTDWVDPCQTEIRILRPNSTPETPPHGTFELLDPEQRVIKYYDGNAWVRMRCIEPECFCPPGYTKNPLTGLCEQYTPAFYDGTLVVIGQGADNGSYGQYGLALYDEQVWNQTTGITQNSETQLYYGGALNSIIAPSTFLSDLWKYRLVNCGVAKYTSRAWDRKKAYAINDEVLYYDTVSGTFKKHQALSNISANTVSPFNLSPIQDTTNWSSGATLSYADINQNDTTPYEFKYCLNLTSNKTYHIGFSGDNNCYIELQINGTGSFIPVAQVTDSYNFRFWYVVPINLPAGNHVLKIKGENDGSGTPVSTGIEIYDMSLTGSTNPVEKFKEEFLYQPGTTSIEPLAHTGDTYAKLEPYVIFSTSLMINKSVPIPNDIDPSTGEPYVPYCADGSTADFCNGAPVCPIVTPCSETPIP